MAFSSIAFLFLFLPFTLTIYFLVGKRFRNIFLLAANLVFYAWGEGTYILVLLVCIVGNYCFGALIEKNEARGERGASFDRSKLYLIVAIVFNLGLMAYFKYLNFIVQNINEVLAAASIKPVTMGHVHLPLGISFFIFQSLSYVVDVYRRDVKATYSLIDFAVYKSLFPQLIAGPIIRYRDVAGQVVNRIVSVEKFSAGINRFIIGLGKKVLVANTVAVAADQIFLIPIDQLRPSVAWLGVVCYTIQIYFDFSGYSDMAIGLGKMFGFDFLENFNHPYISRSIQEFWRRWHISLSTWFRDYLYIPLGGNRCGPNRTWVNLMVVFFLCGLWHGASWTFVVWGLWHGLFLVLERTRFGRYLRSSWAPVGHAYTLLVVIVGWVFFRCNTIGDAFGFIGVMFGFYEKGFTVFRNAMFTNWEFLLALCAGVVFSMPPPKFREYIAVSSGPVAQVAGQVTEIAVFLFLWAVFLFSTMALASGTYNPFIYFRF